MKEFMSYLIIIAIIAFIGFICYMIVRRSNGNTEPIFPFNNKQPVPPAPAPGGAPVNQSVNAPYEEEVETGIFTEWSVVQLDPNTGVPIKKQNLKVPENGKFTIGRSKTCSFVLDGATSQDYTSRTHLGVGKDANGYFAKPLSRGDGSIALTYIEGSLVMESFDLVDKQVIWLGNIPIAFVLNADVRKDLSFNPGSKRDEATFERDHEDTMTFSRNNVNQNSSTNVFSR